MAPLMEGVTDPRPLTAEDNRETFDCGRESLNQWLRRHAWRNQQDGTSRVTVVCDPETGRIAGYVTLSATTIRRAWLAKTDQRNRPDPLPAILLGQLAVDIRHHGIGCAHLLVQYAFRTAKAFSGSIGCFGVVVHPLDAELHAFFGRFGFRNLPFDPAESMIVRIRDLIHNGF